MEKKESYIIKIDVEKISRKGYNYIPTNSNNSINPIYFTTKDTDKTWQTRYKKLSIEEYCIKRGILDNIEYCIDRKIKDDVRDFSKRNELHSIMQKIEKKELDIITLFDMKDLGNKKLKIYLLDFFITHNVRIIIINDKIDTLEPESFTQLKIILDMFIYLELTGNEE